MAIKNFKGNQLLGPASRLADLQSFWKTQNPMTMRFFRNRRNSILSMIVFGFIILTFVFWGFYESGSPSLTALTTVNGEEVSQSEYQRILSAELERYGQVFGGEGMNRQLVEFVERQVATMLVTRKALAHEANRTGIVVGPEDIRQELRQIEAFQDPQLRRFSPRVYEEVMRVNRISPRQFERSIAEEIASTRFRSLIEKSIVVSEPQIEEALKIQGHRFNLQTARITPDAIKNSGLVRITEEELKTYYETNASQYLAPERRRIRIARLDTVDALRRTEISDAEIENFYQSKVESSTESRWEQERVRALHILVSDEGRAGRQEAQKILQDLRREKEKLPEAEFESFFRRMAKNQSDDYNSAFRGGDLGYLARAENVAPVDKALFESKSGELIGPISSEFGNHLLFVLDRTSADKSLSNRRDEIRYLLAEEQNQKEVESTLARVRAQIVGRPQDFSPLLEELGFEITVTDPLDLSARDTTIPFPIIQKSFESPVKQWQAPEEFEDNLYVYRTEEIESPKPLDFESARGRAEETLFFEKSDALLRQWKEEIQSGERNWSSLKDLGATMRQHPEFKVFQEESVPGFERSELVLRQAQSLSETDTVKGPLYLQDDIIFVYGSKFENTSDLLTAEERAALREELSTAKRASILQSFIEGVVSAARIPEDFRTRFSL
jgi:peptidyl-prolyl cis-trans isomerase D